MSDQQQRLRLAKRPDETKELGKQESGVVAESDWGTEGVGAPRRMRPGDGGRVVDRFDVTHDGKAVGIGERARRSLSDRLRAGRLGCFQGYFRCSAPTKVGGVSSFQLAAAWHCGPWGNAQAGRRPHTGDSVSHSWPEARSLLCETY